MSTSFELYGKETFLDQSRKDFLDAATRNRLLHPSRLSNVTSPEKKERLVAQAYRLAYVMVLVLFVTLLVVEVVEAVSGHPGGGGGGSFYLVR